MTAEERGATGISGGTITEENMYFRQEVCVLLVHLRIPQEDVTQGQEILAMAIAICED